MLESMEGGFDVSRHREVTGLFLVVPFDLYNKVGTAGPVGGCFVLGFEGGKEMIGVLTSNILDTEVVNT